LNSTTGLASFTGNASESQTVTISTIDDEDVESIHETLIVSGTSNNSSVLVGSNATITLVNDDKGIVSITGDTTVTFGNTATVYLTLDKEVPTGFDVSVSTSVSSPYTAGNNNIGAISPSTVSFTGSDEGEAKTITIGTVDKNENSNETFAVEISLSGCTGSCDWADYVDMGSGRMITLQP